MKESNDPMEINAAQDNGEYEKPINEEGKAAILLFFRLLGAFCTKVPTQNGGSLCEQCCMRMFCYTAPQDEAKPAFAKNAIDYLNLADWDERRKNMGGPSR